MKLCGILLATASLFFAAVCFSVHAQDVAPDSLVQKLLADAATQLKVGSETAKPALDRLKELEPSLSPAQKGEYLKLLASSFAFKGMYRDQVDASRRGFQFSADPDQRASLLYLLADGYASLGEYDNALQAMNESIQLLPKVKRLVAKADVLQSAVSLFESMDAYDEAMEYADRLAALPDDGSGSSMCFSAADRAELAYVRHDTEGGKAELPKVLQFCSASGYKVIALSVQALDASERLSLTEGAQALKESVQMLDELAKTGDRSDYSVRLANAIANRYLSMGAPTTAEQYANRALQWINSGSAIQLRQQSTETMANVLRAEGKLEQALNYLNQSNKLWAKVLEERSKKGIAYQKMKFQAQDQSNQLKFLSRINTLLTKERELQDRNAQILELLVGVIVLLLGVVLIWLYRTWRQKNDFRTYSQIDGLTKISNRTHFIACAHQAFKDPRGSISIVLFDMDEFKLINDTYSHASGDWVLKTVSSTIANCLRSQDLFGRLGGEEFAICLPHTSEADAAVLAERCRSAIEAIDSSSSGHQFSLSASFGIAVRPSNGSAGFEEVLAAADRALYQAKHLGRNRIAPYGEVMGHAPLVA